MQQEILRIDSLPVLQNKVYATASLAQASSTGDIALVQDLTTGLSPATRFVLSR